MSVKLQTDTVWNVPKYGLFCGPYFPVFGLNTEKYEVSLRRCELSLRYSVQIQENTDQKKLRI